MGTGLATVLVTAVGIYVGLGLLFAIPFVIFGAQRVDPAARGGTRGFRLLILPGVAALWPVLLRRWIRGAAPPEERNDHRLAAREERR